MRSRFVRLFALMLALLACAGVLASCRSRDLLAKTEVASLLLDAKGRINALVTLDVRTEDLHDGETLRFFEILPGETPADALKREPLDEVRVGAEVKFRVPLHDEDGRSRLYSSFCVAFEDGSLLAEDGFYVENPQLLAQNTEDFLWTKSPKAIQNADPHDAVSMSVMHTSYEMSFSELIDGTDSFVYQGESYAYSLPALERLDKQVLSATETGMQVSLILRPDARISAVETVALLDMLSARYAGGEHGLVSAILLRTERIDEMSSLCRLTSLALRSHVANGRVYVIAPSVGRGEIQSFFENLRLAFAASGEISWGAAVVPQISNNASWESADEDAMSVSNLSPLSMALFTSPEEGRISYFALCDVAFSAENEELQAASYAYTYLSAVSANAGLIFYRDYLHAQTGLRGEQGEARRILSVLKEIDKGLSPADRRMCEQTAGNAWNVLADAETRTLVKGTANIGTTGLQEKPWIDFSDGSLHGFTGAGSLTAPESRTSAAWGSPVLYTWVDPARYTDGGVRKILRGNEIPKGATALSVQLLTQIPATESCRVHLQLDGVSAEGRHLTYENSVELSGGKWQTLTFGISAFAAEVDLSQPCVMTLTTEPLSETSEEYVLWIRGINVRYPVRDVAGVWAIGIVLGGLVIGFLIVFLIWRVTAANPNKRRRAKK